MAAFQPALVVQRSSASNRALWISGAKSSNKPNERWESRVSLPSKDYQFIDVPEPAHGVQVTVRDDGAVVWVSVDGLTVCRISRIPYLEINLPDQNIEYGNVAET